MTLHRMRENYKIAVYAGALVPTYAPDTWLVLFRQRVASWDVTTHAKTGAQIRELCFSCCQKTCCGDWRTIVLKPFQFYEVMCVILDWQRRHGMLLDPVYTGKLFYGLSQMLAQGEIDAGTRIVALHTGGEQGRRGYGFLQAPT